MLASSPDTPPNPDAPIEVRELTKVYQVSERQGGVWAALRGTVRRVTRDVRAVDGVSFQIGAGEIVGFLGPNGAGKTTTLKMLSGLLYPTSGEARVLGHAPYKRERSFLRQITLVMGNRNQLVWDLPAVDSLLINQAIYRLSEERFQRTVEELTELLDLGPLLHKPVRQLSLGERMKCELAAALLHRPSVLFLDEPTIGLDVTAQGRIREFIREYNRQTGATVLLTSHYMADVVALCKRIIVIHHGKLLYDGLLSTLASHLAPFKIVSVVVEDGWSGPVAWDSFGEVLELEDNTARLRIPAGRVAEVAGMLLARLRIADLTIEDPPVEDVIDQIFRGGTL